MFLTPWLRGTESMLSAKSIGLFSNLLFETGSCYGAQVGLELMILWLQLHEC